MSRERDVKGQRCEEKERKEMSGERDGTRKSEKQMSRERAVEGKGYQRESGPAHILAFFLNYIGPDFLKDLPRLAFSRLLQKLTGKPKTWALYRVNPSL